MMAIHSSAFGQSATCWWSSDTYKPATASSQLMRPTPPTWKALIYVSPQYSEPFTCGSVPVRGHVRHNSINLEPHYSTAPDSSRLNNWSTQGNVNSCTGKVGTRR